MDLNINRVGPLFFIQQKGMNPISWSSQNGKYLIVISSYQQEIQSSEFFLDQLLKDPMSALLSLIGDFIVLGGDQDQSIAAIDPSGIRTLYHAKIKGEWLYAEHSSCLTGPNLLPKEVEPVAVYHFLNFGCVPTPWSIYRNISRLPPGCYLRCEKGDRHAVQSYWDIRYHPSSQPENALLHQLRQQIEKTVAITLKDTMQAVPPSQIGLFLSGGTDSSTLCGLSAKRLKESLAVYTVYFKEKNYSELEFAIEAVKHFGLKHRTILLTPTEFLKSQMKLIAVFDEPFANASVAAAHACTRQAALDGIHTLLAGDGGDEIFAGNERYLKEKFFNFYGALPGWIRFPIESLLRLSPEGSSLERIKKMIERAHLSNPTRFFSDFVFAEKYREPLLTDGFLGSIGNHRSDTILNHHWASCDTKSELDRLLYLDMKTTIADNDLRKVVGAAVAEGIVVRFPFLHRELVDFAASVPPGLKIKGFTKRYLFKKAVDPLLPRKILSKKKQGMGVPLGHWIRNDKSILKFTENILFDGRSAKRGIIREPFLQHIFQKHQEGQGDFARGIWRLVILESWYRTHMEGESPESLVA